jgi:hypothetical protein
LTFHITRRRTAKAFHFVSRDIYWRKAEHYIEALRALHTDACDNYVGGPNKTARANVLDLLAAAVLNAQDLMQPFETQDLFADDTPADAFTPFQLQVCFPYSARHYASMVEDMRDYAVGSMKVQDEASIHAYGTLPALLRSLASNLNALVELERVHPDGDFRLVSWLERPTRMPLIERRPSHVAR